MVGTVVAAAWTAIPEVLGANAPRDAAAADDDADQPLVQRNHRSPDPAVAGVDSPFAAEKDPILPREPHCSLG